MKWVYGAIGFVIGFCAAILSAAVAINSANQDAERTRQKLSDSMNVVMEKAAQTIAERNATIVDLEAELERRQPKKVKGDEGA